MRIPTLASVLALLAIAGALVAPTPVAAAETLNLAGRPVNGYAQDNSLAPRQWMNPCSTSAPCYGYYYDRGTAHGIAYAKIDGRIALLYPWHARDHASYDGKNVYSKNDVKIGTFAADVCAGTGGVVCASHFDLAVIWIDAEDRPSSLNQVYRGATAGNDWWTITSNPTVDCSEMSDGSYWGDSVFQNYQRTWQTTDVRTLNTMTGFLTYDAWNNCLVITSKNSHTPARDSGTPWVLLDQQNTVTFFATYSHGPVGGPYKLDITPLYGGLNVLDAYWESHGGNTGADLCRNAGCT